MTTIAQVKHVTRPLLAGNPDLALVGRLVVVKPVRHILCGVYLDRYSDVAAFAPMFGAVFLFEPGARFSFNWSREIYFPGRGPWSVDDPSTPEFLRDDVESLALPLLRAIGTIDDFAAYACKRNFRHTYLNQYAERRIYIETALGHREAAMTLCAYFTSELAKRRYEHDMQGELELIKLRLCPMILRDDIAGLAAFLHELEETAVRRNKLEKIWERTPFPLEERGWI